MCRQLKHEDLEMAAVISKWTPLICKIANKLRKTDPENDFDDYVQDTIKAVLYMVRYYRGQEAAIAAFAMLGFPNTRKTVNLAGFVGMNLHNFFVNTIRSKFLQKRGFSKEIVDGELEVTKFASRIPFYGESDGGDWSVLDIAPAYGSNPESRAIQSELLQKYKEKLTAEENKLVGFLLSEDETYLTDIKGIHQERLGRVQNGEKYVRMTGITFTIGAMSHYLGQSRKQTRNTLESCRDKFQEVAGL